MHIVSYVSAFAVGLLIGALFKVPALAAATLLALVAAGAALLLGEPLPTVAAIALPGIVCMQIGYVIAAAFKGSRKS